MSPQNLATIEMIRQLKERLDKAFGKGIIVVRNDNLEPAEIYGGTWTKIQGRFLLASGGGTH